MAVIQRRVTVSTTPVLIVQATSNVHLCARLVLGSGVYVGGTPAVTSENGFLVSDVLHLDLIKDQSLYGVTDSGLAVLAILLN